MLHATRGLVCGLSAIYGPECRMHGCTARPSAEPEPKRMCKQLQSKAVTAAANGIDVYNQRVPSACMIGALSGNAALTIAGPGLHSTAAGMSSTAPAQSHCATRLCKQTCQIQLHGQHQVRTGGCCDTFRYLTITT